MWIRVKVVEKKRRDGVCDSFSDKIDRIWWFMDKREGVEERIEIDF